MSKINGGGLSGPITPVEADLWAWEEMFPCLEFSRPPQASEGGVSWDWVAHEIGNDGSQGFCLPPETTQSWDHSSTLCPLAAERSETEEQYRDKSFHGRALSCSPCQPQSQGAAHSSFPKAHKISTHQVLLQARPARGPSKQPRCAHRCTERRLPSRLFLVGFLRKKCCAWQETAAAPSLESPHQGSPALLCAFPA